MLRSACTYLQYINLKLTVEIFNIARAQYLSYSIDYRFERLLEELPVEPIGGDGTESSEGAECIEYDEMGICLFYADAVECYTD